MINLCISVYKHFMGTEIECTYFDNFYIVQNFKKYITRFLCDSLDFYNPKNRNLFQELPLLIQID